MRILKIIKIYSSIYGNEGRYFLIEGYFSFYTLPEETALKIDRKSKLNFGIHM